MLCMMCSKRKEKQGVYPLCEEHKKEVDTHIEYLKSNEFNGDELYDLRTKYENLIQDIYNYIAEINMIIRFKHVRIVEIFRKTCLIDLYIKYIKIIDTR